MGETYTITETGVTEEFSWQVSTSTTYEWKQFRITYMHDGVQGSRIAYYGGALAYLGDTPESVLVNTALGDGTNKIEYPGQIDASRLIVVYKADDDAIIADRGGMGEEEEEEEEETGSTTSSDLGTSTMYFASLGDNMEIGSDSGLIKNGTFSLKWNNFDSTTEWNDGTKGRYNSIEDGEVPGTITVIKESVYDNATHAVYNTFYDLNTGASQTSPTITLINGSGGKEFSVEYGSVEATALENKYKRYDSGWNNALDGMIDGMVQAAIDGSYQSKAVLNFKKTKVKEFKEKTITAFPDQIMVGTTEDPSDEEIMGTDGIMTDAITPTMNDAGAAGGMTENY